VEEREFLEDIERLMGRHLLRIEEHDYPPTQPLPPPTDLAHRRVGRRPQQKKKSGGRPSKHRNARRPNRPRRSRPRRD
jgi:ATP-dependent RNA helicase RhlE